MINVLEPKLWSNDSEEDNDEDVPATCKKTTVLSQHISFLKDFFKTYKDFSDEQIDTLEIMLTKLYKFFDITEKTDLSLLRHEDFPILSDLYEYIDEEYKHFTENRNNIYTRRCV